jgi:hypothetical protein
MTDPGASPLPAAPVEIPALAFANAEGAKAWVNTLPFGSVAQMHDAVLGQLRALAAAQQSPRERATITEVMRLQVAHLHTELARRYAGKPQPAVGREQEAADQAIALWNALQEQYAMCLKPLLEGDPELAGVKAKLLQRGLYVRTGSPAGRRRPRCGRSCTPTTAWPRCWTARSLRCRTTSCRTASGSPATRPTATRCCSGSPIPAR